MKNLKFNLSTLRHSCSHVLAQAVKELWPEKWERKRFKAVYLPKVLQAHLKEFLRR